ncbi:MAG: sensor histidine kinase [Vulcanimicrobiaceae bacterium]
MRSNTLFAGFAQRLTRGYVLLAFLLIVGVAGTTTTIAFVQFATSLNDAVATSAHRVEQFAAQEQARHQSLAQYARALVKDAQRPRIHVFVRDQRHAIIAGKDEPASRMAKVIGALVGIHGRVTSVPGGIIIVAPDLDGFTHFLAFYWSITLPVGILAILVAWLVGRQITRNAIEPLADVTHALRKIADGDFTPEPLLHSNTELRDLTGAYDDVAYRLSAATAERLRNEAEMRQFIADAGHELRTPLTVVMGYLDALQQGVVRDPEGISRVHETMLAESRRMRTVIEKLIFLARLERKGGLRSEPIDLVELGQRAVDALGPIAGHRMHYTHTGNPTVVGDDAELYEALKNVLENALKYAPESAVTFTVGIDHRLATATVSDRGPGMDAVDIEHAFDRFYRGNARTQAEGSGLGLAIAKRALDRIGGSIAIESTLGQGTTVSLRFPIGGWPNTDG